MVPLLINPICTLYRGSPFKGFLGGVQSFILSCEPNTCGSPARPLWFSRKLPSRKHLWYTHCHNTWRKPVQLCRTHKVGIEGHGVLRGPSRIELLASDFLGTLAPQLTSCSDGWGSSTLHWPHWSRTSSALFSSMLAIMVSKLGRVVDVQGLLKTSSTSGYLSDNLQVRFFGFTKSDNIWKTEWSDCVPPSWPFKYPVLVWFWSLINHHSKIGAKILGGIWGVA